MEIDEKDSLHFHISIISNRITVNLPQSLESHSILQSIRIVFFLNHVGAAALV